MKVVLDTNIIVSGLINPGGTPGTIYRYWLEKQFVLLASEEQITEVRNTLRKPSIRYKMARPTIGKAINDLREIGIHVRSSPYPQVSPDPTDNFLLAMAEYGRADFLITGDKSHLLQLASYKQTRIVSARQFLDLLG